MSGKLFVVPTPIGNLEDMTPRAIRILQESDLILAEDTRTSGKLMKAFSIETKMKAFHQHNEHKKLDEVVTQLKNGNTYSIISDAGTPGISDPGFLLVRECINQGVSVECLPGPTAFVPALINSGFPMDRFVFEGFIPQKKGRSTRLKEMLEERKTVVFYESPHRILKLLSELEDLAESRKLSISREISKMYEETIIGTAKELKDHFSDKKIKGEFVIVLEGKTNG